MSVVIHWFRRDLRLADNLALHAACRSGAAVIPLFILDEQIYRSSRAGTARMAFLLDALHSLDQSLRQYNTKLLLRSGNPIEVISQLVAEVEASELYFNADYSPYARRRDQALQQSLGIPVKLSPDLVLLPPGQVVTGTGAPYTVFTPFRTNWNKQPKPPVSTLALRAEMFHPVHNLHSMALPTLPEAGFTETPPPLPAASENAAQQFLEAFAAQDIYIYEETRNELPIQPFIFPRPRGTSYLSPYLRLGLLSPRQAYHTARTAYQHAAGESQRKSVETWVSELAWREFYQHILWYFPHVLQQDFKTTYRTVRWSQNTDHLQAWQTGQTGYPIVDAAMRQLNAIGWMPNRARMIVASFLTKDLFIHWRAGERYFMQHLIDGDTAANNGGWQWSAGTGTDAQPYFRIFNPISQSKQFATPAYLRYWLPELAQVPDSYIHAPWEMSRPPADYPAPIIDHAVARARTLAAFKKANEGN